MKLLIISLLILFSSCTKDVPSPEEKLVDNVLNDMVNPQNLDVTKPLETQGVSTVTVKNTLNFCKDTIRSKNLTIKNYEKKIEELEDEMSDLKEELAETKEKSGQVDLLNKILVFVVLGALGYLVFQLLPVIRKFFGV